MKKAGIVLIVIGIVMVFITGFNIITKKKVVDIGPIEINKEESTPIQWSPIIGGVLIVAGIAMAAGGKK
jgi:UDP-N-acetylmuramyl pentapeptide phosphotransferase/UDP-N-acetylglucosamine-1-phosphate transferase